MEQDAKISHREANFRHTVGWIAIIGTTLFVVGFFAFLLLTVWRAEDWILQIIKDHFAAIFITPLACIGALCVVLILRYTSGPIEFEAWGFKFKGSSVPVIFWILSFLAIIWSTKLLW